MLTAKVLYPKFTKEERIASEKVLLISSTILDWEPENGKISIDIPTLARKTKLPEREIEIFLKIWFPCCFD
jgi:hypothetical protein